MVPRYLQVSDPEVDKKKLTEEMVILQLLSVVSDVQMQPMEIHFNYESQEHHLISDGKHCIIFFLVVLGGGECCYFAVLVSSVQLVFFIACHSLY